MRGPRMSVFETQYPGSTGFLRLPTSLRLLTHAYEEIVHIIC